MPATICRAVGAPLYGYPASLLKVSRRWRIFAARPIFEIHHPDTGEQINLEAALPSGFPESVVASTGFALEGQRDGQLPA
jgi:hypothetical protein